MDTLSYALVGWFVLLVGCMSAAALAQEKPAREFKPLDEIVESLEKSGYTIVEAEIDDGHWEVDVQKGEESYELHIDPATGKTIATHRDDTDPAPSSRAMKLSKLLRGIKRRGHAAIVSAEFKRGKWEFETRRGRQKYELKVDAESGKILSDRMDD
jgi:uncharacterized membrane protein YkoI